MMVVVSPRQWWWGCGSCSTYNSAVSWHYQQVSAAVTTELINNHCCPTNQTRCSPLHRHATLYITISHDTWCQSEMRQKSTAVGLSLMRKWMWRWKWKDSNTKRVVYSSAQQQVETITWRNHHTVKSIWTKQTWKSETNIRTRLKRLNHTANKKTVYMEMSGSAHVPSISLWEI